MAEYTVVTYGAGEILNTTFNAIAAIINGKSGSLYQPLVRLGLFLGLTMTTFRMIYGDYMNHLLKNWFVPIYLALTFFFAPTCTLHIKDPTTHQPPYTVDNVPIGLGMFAGTISKISNSITEKIESVFSLPDDLKYNKTGAVFASNLIANSRTFHITDANLAETMREFVNQCIVYDALLGTKYTIDDLLKSDDIWAIATQNPSSARCFTFKKPGIGQVPIIYTCKKGAEELKKLLEKDIKNAFQYFGNRLFSKDDGSPHAGGNLLKPSEELKKYLPTAFNHMGKMAKDASALMQQQMMVYSVVEALENKSTALGNAPNFAVRKAYLQQRASQETAASIGAQKLVAIKNVLEALIYTLFILILPMAMLPLGWRFIGKWLELLIWIQLWPPLYAILNFIMNMAARSKGIGGITLGDHTGITIANSVGFMDLHADMAAQAGYLSLAVGSIAYAIIKAGAAGFMHLASHMGAPTLSAAASAAESMVTGNYSFGNVSQGTMQAYNSTFGQEQWSPSYSAGSFAQNDGVVSRTTSSDGSHMVNVASSNLRSSVNWGESMSNAYTEQAAQATQAAQSQLKAAATAEGDAIRNTLDFASHQARQESSGDNYSRSKSAGDNQSFTNLLFITLLNVLLRKMVSGVEEAKRSFLGWSGGISIGTPGGLMIGSNIGVNGGRETSESSTQRELYSKAQEYMKQNNFQDALQKSMNATHEGRYGTVDDQGKRYVDSINAAHDRSEQLRHEAAANLQKSKNYSQMASWTKQNSGSINSNLNQEYVEWLQGQNLPNSAGAMGIHEAETILANRPELDLMYQRRFLEGKMEGTSFMGSNGLLTSEKQVEEVYKAHQQNIKFTPKQYMQDVKKVATKEGYVDNFQLNRLPMQAVKDELSIVDNKIEEMRDTLEEKSKLIPAEIQSKLVKKS